MSVRTTVTSVSVAVALLAAAPAGASFDLRSPDARDAAAGSAATSATSHMRDGVDVLPPEGMAPRLDGVPTAERIRDAVDSLPPASNAPAGSVSTTAASDDDSLMWIVVGVGGALSTIVGLALLLGGRTRRAHDRAVTH